MEKKGDTIFNEEIPLVPDFKFTSKVANVFDDMVTRSVPYYPEMQRMIGELAGDHYQPGTVIYDLGCSTGATLIHMDQFVPEDIAFTGVDDSESMLEKCRSKLDEYKIQRKMNLVCADLNDNVHIENASVVVLCLTLQFIRPINRLKLLRQIFNGMNKDGVLILVEKVLAEDSSFNRKFIKYYYDFKRRNNYSELEISQKREALENVLIPYKLSEDITLLKEAGFSNVDTFFKWYNFAGIIAQK
ncbi:MAG TPA: carboxy-S-adenosyl-L-methionine synthase CmoA [Chitinophagaceae bacterium]|nr:carboxy-S-adenosyl-L-methionine synthase CmoA [Chitinophagaceae bacterium]